MIHANLVKNLSNLQMYNPTIMDTRYAVALYEAILEVNNHENSIHISEIKLVFRLSNIRYRRQKVIMSSLKAALCRNIRVLIGTFLLN